MIKAEVVADSKNEFGNRITTMIVTFPRIILAEFNTHRMFSRNSASSRAIPFEKMIKSVEENPFIPIAWQKDHKGMQGTEYFTDPESIKDLEFDHLNARDAMVTYAKAQAAKGLTKQLCNRYLEPFMWHTVIVTATEWENFFALRCPKYEYSEDIQKGYDVKYAHSKKDWLSRETLGFEKQDSKSIIEWLQLNKGQAEIHMMALAEAMWDAYNESTPKELKAGEWHIPFNLDGDETSRYALTETARIKIATARCARVSYTIVGEEAKEPNYENDIKLHDRLAASGHWSPFEHCARVMSRYEYEISVRGIMLEIDHSKNPMAGHFDVGVERYAPDNIMGWSGNFRGFVQYRKMFTNENIIV